MNRLEVVLLGLVVEWDEATGEVTVGCGGEKGWDVVWGIREAVARVSPGFEDLGTLERRSSGSCFSALDGFEKVVMWRVRFWDAREARLPALVVRETLKGWDELR